MIVIYYANFKKIFKLFKFQENNYLIVKSLKNI